MTSVETRCLCHMLPAGSICTSCAYARGFPAKLYLANRRYDDSPSQLNRRCVECGRQVNTDYDRCYDCRVQRAHRAHLLVGDSESFAAGGEDLYSRRVREYGFDQVGGSVENVLAVVDHQ